MSAAAAINEGSKRLRRRAAFARFSIALLALVACTDPAPPKPPAIESVGEHVRFGSDADVPPLCEGTLPYVDGYVETLADLFAVELDQAVDYYYVTDESRMPCSDHPETHGTRGSTVYSVVAPLEHELVHGVRSFAGFSHFFLEEGAAELWGDDSHRFPFRQQTAGDAMAALESATPDGWIPTSMGSLAGSTRS